ncbi:MAG: 50S ribosomal protein L11 methyltransferase [Bacteroidetes bacterium]|nr:50S ribosomal protein L11 methyltransferase [Bacteroidota bacterium]
MNHIQVTIPARDVEEQEMFIALMAAMGYEGFEQEEEMLRAFIPEEQFDKGMLVSLLEPLGATFETERIKETNWNEEWEKNFQPVVVDGFCAIRAHFHAPIAGVEHELVITPKMSFGTGHHATTFMMIQAMQQLDLKGRRVFDFGTGTGVLAILAERLGAASVLATDNDDWSIENARENVTNNGCTAIRVVKMDRVPEGPFDAILANINKHVIIGQLAALEQQLTPGGVILLSGLLDSDFQDIENEAVKNNISISVRITKGSWICLRTEKRLK